MGTVISRDGTSIAYDRRGRGPAVILVGGGLVDRSENAALATALAEHFTTYNYDRRGRGSSGDTLPYAVDREIEDVSALVIEAGGSAHLCGISSGGALALEAAAAGTAVDRLAIYEVPYSVGDDAARRWRAYREQLGPALAGDRRGEALALFMRVAGASEEDIAGARHSSSWREMLVLAHTLGYDAAILGDGAAPTARLVTITSPTLVATGGGDDFFEQAADAVAARVPNAERRTLAGQSHVVDARAFAAVLERFFT
jgi:pimeloyl-ACP methyl ester carboxylesterase